MANSNQIPPQVKCLRPAVYAELESIEPLVSPRGWRLYPCDVQFDDGAWRQRVYIYEAHAYIVEWGVWPWQDSGKSWVPAEGIRSARSSTDRLAPQFARILYDSGESGMGYCAYSVDIRDGRRLYFVTGNAVDFPCWPRGVAPEDVVAVTPHDRNPDHQRRPPRKDELTASYAWSPYRSPDSA